MEASAELLRGIAALLWPITVLTVVVIFRRELRTLLSRLRKAKAFGQEVELDESLDQLERRTEELSEVQEPITPPAVETTNEDLADDVFSQVREEAAGSPKAALVLVSAELERAVRDKLGDLGQMDLLRGRRPITLRTGLEELARRTNLSMETLDAVHRFSEVRNRIVHGYTNVDEEEVRRAINLGLDLLTAVRSVPSQVTVVLYPHVQVYADPEGKELRTDCHGVMLEIIDTDDSDMRTSVFPTTRTHFVKGMRVAWEWSSRRKWGESWYRNPESGEIEYGWSGSLEFIGRNLEEI
jgi:hypothetical protein